MPRLHRMTRVRQPEGALFRSRGCKGLQPSKCHQTHAKLKSILTFAFSAPLW